LPASESHVRRLLALKIKKLRRSRKLSQESLADRAAMQRSYLADLETGRRNPSVRTLLKLANALGVSIRSLFDE